MENVANRKMQDYLECLFGSDEAIGVRVRVAGHDAPMTLEAFERFKALHPGFDENGDFSMEMPDGSSVVVCTNYANHIEQTLPGRVHVVGFFCEDNPDCEFSKRDYAEGHDFAIVDDRYLVDPWLRLVYMETDEPMVYDLHNPTEAAKAGAMYGQRSRWINAAVSA